MTRRARLLSYFGVERDRDENPADTFPINVAPFIRLAKDGESGVPVVNDGLFGLLPHFASEVGFGRRTYNARSETVDRLPSFRDAWANGQRCIIPAEALYEPNYEGGKAERWAVYQEGYVPFGVAGIYTQWRDFKTGRDVYSFSMLTVNADDHPFIKRFQKPEDEKRMVVILHPSDYAEWLSCPVDEAKRFLKQWTGPLLGEPLPLPPRAPKASSVSTAKPRKPEPPETGRLF
ncbi:SOS response-associated peptidase [Caenimonas soli]|uniref:SOS response-associated peptidase n=1 Tax=Caenimonas soli TaxID=2735555 RepID=UPI00155305C2|nr:SOS response-associated peptidase family protein [Caenimonas soli]NPC56334.1 SOS response-associated peptidase [Caenimonas soli]